MKTRAAIAFALFSGSSAAYGATLPSRSGTSGLLDVPDAEPMPLGTAGFAMEMQAQGSPGTRTSIAPSPLALTIGMGAVQTAVVLREGGVSGDARPGPLLLRPSMKVHLIDSGTWNPALAIEAAMDRVNVAPVPQLRFTLSTPPAYRLRFAGFAGASSVDLRGRVVRPEGGLAGSWDLRNHLQVALEAVELRDGPMAGGALRWSANELVALSVGAHYMPDAKAWVVSFGFGAGTPLPPKKPPPEPEIVARAEQKKPQAITFLDDQPHFRLRVHESGEQPRHLHFPGTSAAPKKEEKPEEKPAESAKPAEKPGANAKPAGKKPAVSAKPAEKVASKKPAKKPAEKPSKPSKSAKPAVAVKAKLPLPTPGVPAPAVPVVVLPPMPEVEVPIGDAGWNGKAPQIHPSDYAVASPAIGAKLELPTANGKKLSLDVEDALLVQLPRKESVLTPEQEEALEALMARARSNLRTVLVWGRAPTKNGRVLDAREQAARVAQVLAWDAEVNNASRVVVRTARVPGIEAPDVVVAVLRDASALNHAPAPKLPVFDLGPSKPQSKPEPAPKAAPEEKPEAAEPKPEVAEPKPAPVEVKPAVVEPKPEVAEPKPAPVEVKPAVVEPKPEVAEPKPAPVEVKPAVVEPTPTPAPTPSIPSTRPEATPSIPSAKPEPAPQVTPDTSKLRTPSTTGSVGTPVPLGPASVNPMGLVPTEEPVPTAGPKGRVDEPLVERLRSGSAGREQLRDALMKHRPEIQRCVDHELKRSQLRKATGSVQLTIDGRGNVKSATLDGEKLSGSYLEKCIQSAAKRWRFPASGESYDLDIPLNVSGKEDGP